jgi:hypothetical protein
MRLAIQKLIEEAEEMKWVGYLYSNSRREAAEFELQHLEVSRRGETERALMWPASAPV